MYKLLGIASQPVLHPVPQSRKVIGSWDMYHCNQCEKSIQMISILLYVNFSPEIVEKAWTIIYRQRIFNHFNSRFKVKQIIYQLEALFTLNTMA